MPRTTSPARSLAAVWMGLGTLAVVALSAAPAAEARVRPHSPDLETWLAAVTSHTPGRVDDAVTVIAPWSRTKLETVLAEAADVPLADAALLKRAAVLHADIAVAHRRDDGYSLPSDGRALDYVQDGRFVRTQGGTVHWSFARRILERVRPDEDVRLWYRATSAFLQQWNEYSELSPHLERARARFGPDPVLLLYEGALHASYAEPRVQLVLPPLPLGAKPEARTIGDANQELVLAERRFEKALELDPGLSEARIRLADVRGRRGQHEAAAAELERVTRQPLETAMEYYAWLLLGRELALLGRSEEARAAFERARDAFPAAQSPRLGLSYLSRAAGERQAARQALEVLRGDLERAQDPWWIFNWRHAPGADELLEEMARRLAP